MGVNLLAPINQLGYGIAGLNLLCNLQEETAVSLFPIGNVECPALKHGVVRRALENAKFYDPLATSIRLWHQNSLAEHAGCGLRYAFTFFEVNLLKPNEIHHIDQHDGLIVVSEWAREVALKSGVTIPVSVVPLGVDREIFHEDVKADRREVDYTVFVNVGKWEYRKGHDFLLDCFCKAFKRTDKVMLRMLCDTRMFGGKFESINEEWATRYKTSPMGTNIQLLGRQRGQGDVARVIAASDVGIFPARAEAWNLDLLECMSMGRNVIAANYSGHTAYINAQNCHLIETAGLETAKDGVWFDGYGEWAELGSEQAEQTIEHMRSLHRAKQTGQLVPNSAGIETAKKFSWRKSAKELLRVINQ